MEIERSELYERIEKRVDDMIAKGLIDEVMASREQGCTLSHTSMQALGYKQVMYYLEGFVTKDKMIEEIKRRPGVLPNASSPGSGKTSALTG